MTRLAFTLVELLLVVAIIATLMAITVPPLSRARTRARIVAEYNGYFGKLDAAIANGLSRHDYEIEHGRLTRNFHKAMELQR